MKLEIDMQVLYIATGALIVIGAVMAVLGMFGGPEYVVMGMGLVALIAAGALNVVAIRR